MEMCSRALQIIPNFKETCWGCRERVAVTLKEQCLVIEVCFW